MDAIAATSPGTPVASADLRLQAVEELLDAREQTSSLEEGQWAAFTAHVVDAALSSDDATLESAYTGLQWMAAQLRVQGDGSADVVFEGGRVRGVLDLVRWHLRRSVSAAAPTIPRAGLVARMLQVVSQHPGSRNQEIAERLGVDQTQVSRAGRHLRGPGLATVRKAGRENAWFVTPRGSACLESLGLDADLPVPTPPATAEEPPEQRLVQDPGETVAGKLPDPAYADVLASILQHEPGDEREVRHSTGLSEVTVAQAIDFLVTHNYVVREPERSGGPPLLRVNGQAHRAIGVTIGPDEVVGVLVDLRSTELCEVSRAVDGSDVAAVVAAVGDVTEVLRQHREAEDGDLVGLGVNLPGHVDPRRGVVVYSPLGPDGQWDEVPLASLLLSATGLPTAVENDVNALALHEKYFGDGQGLCDFAVVFVTPEGEGVGSGLIVGGTLVHGSHGIAGEIGHTPLGERDRRCRCGNLGCLEATVGFSAIRDRFTTVGLPVPGSLAEASASAAQGDPATTVFEQAGEAFGRGVATILSTLDPELIILSGPAEVIDIDGTVPSAVAFTRAARQSTDRYAFSTSASHCRLLTRRLTGEYAARGAASALLLRRVYESTQGPVAAPDADGRVLVPAQDQGPRTPSPRSSISVSRQG